ncbi:MAG: recombinase A [Planctomycetes bacterium]|nr:recombinase A [Planctomycetota bacterium]
MRASRELALSALARLKPARTPRPLAAEPSWSFPELAGRLCELSGARGGTLSLAARLVHDAQRRGETVAWVSTKRSSFFPPDLEAGGVDLASLVVVRTALASANARAADFLMRSGAFGLVVLELDPCSAEPSGVPLALQSRLLAAAQAHDAVVLCLSEKPRGASSLGSLVSFHGEVELARAAASDVASRTRSLSGSHPGTVPDAIDRASADGDGRFTCTLTVRKDKRRAPGWRHVEVCRGPLGLR